MLYYDTIDVPEGIDVNKTTESKECDVCQYWYFLQKGFKFQQSVCNRCHDVLMMSMNVSHVAIFKINNADHRFIISEISKSEVVNLPKNVD